MTSNTITITTTSTTRFHITSVINITTTVISCRNKKVALGQGVVMGEGGGVTERPTYMTVVPRSAAPLFLLSQHPRDFAEFRKGQPFLHHGQQRSPLAPQVPELLLRKGPEYAQPPLGWRNHDVSRLLPVATNSHITLGHWLYATKLDISTAE